VVEAAGGGMDTIRSTLSGTYAMGANVENFEQIATSAVTVTGNGFNNQITGNIGADSLTGGSGADTLTGADGRDRLTGGDGNDLLFGSAGNDTLIGSNNDDILDGGAGADRLDGGSGLDAASYQSAAAAVRVDLVSPSVNTGEAVGDVFVSIENLTGSDFGDELRGNNSANVLVGRAGNDVISAGGNADRLKGGEGADTLQGQGGNDSLEGESGDDLMSGGASARDYFVFHEYGFDPLTRSWGHDVISDFEDGLDLLDFRNSGAYGAPITFASLTITQQGTNTLIVGPHDGESILLLNRPVATVTAADFIFVRGSRGEGRGG
jgi:Ca2+-binding RTX toxin-like protein